MNGEIAVIEDVSKKLIEYKIPFMLTGSIAMNYYNSKSDMQKKDISILLSSGYDKDYVEKWSTELGLKALLAEIVHG